jgi:hypothetical protein
MATIALATLIVLIAGVSAWIIAAVSAGIRKEEAVSAGIRKEDRNFRLTAQAADKASERVRLLTGLYVRDVIRPGAARRETTFV